MDILNQLGRAILQIGGMTPEQIRQQARANKKPKPMPKANTKRPAPKPAEQLVGNNQRQTNLFNQSGKPRDFRNPKVSANRPATTGPNLTRTPRLPAGAPKPPAASPGQMSLFGTNPGAKPSGNFTAPKVPGAGQGTLAANYGSDALKWLKNNSNGGRTAAATTRALQIGAATKLLNGLGFLGAAGGAINQAQHVFNPQNNLLTSLNDLRLTATNGGQIVPGHSRYQAPQPITSGPIGPQQTPEMVGNYQAARDQRHTALRADMPAIPAPAGGSTGGNSFGSAYAPQAAAPARPNTPQPSKPMEQAYGKSGKDLYMSGKKANPLMDKTFGYQTGEHPGSDKKYSLPSEKSQHVDKDGKLRKRKLTIELD